jgi:3-hydroxyacyl-CoA dehydrogenase
MDPHEIRRVVILGANGTMGSGAGALFAARGFDVVMLARSRERAHDGLSLAIKAVRAEAIAEHIRCASYDELEGAVAEADLVLEAVAENLALKQEIFERVELARRPGTVVATVSSGLSITALASGRSDDFRRCFLGVHLFNPPTVIVGTEVIAGRDTDPALVERMVALLEKRLGRVVVQCRDLPAFAGNRVGFKLLNECAQLAAEHGVAAVDALVGPYTGRAMPPLATVDLVGWDVHEAIVDNVHDHTHDEAHDAFVLPDYMERLIEHGHLGNKTPEAGGFYRTASGADGRPVTLVLDPPSGEYRELAARPRYPFAQEIQRLHRVGRYREGMQHFLEAAGPEAELARRVVLGYVSYGLNRVGPDEVVDHPLGVDLIMAYGFNWAPPSALVDLWGRDVTIRAMEALDLKVPAVVRALGPGERLFRHAQTEIGRYFSGR